MDGEDFVNFVAFLENMNFTYKNCDNSRKRGHRKTGLIKLSNFATIPGRK